MKNKKYSRAYVEITNICNRSCSFCPGTKREKKSLNLCEFSHILDSLEGLTEYIYMHVMGEPLIHPELCEFIRLATARGFKCAITTNGTLLKKRASELLSSGVYKINISVHSFEEGREDDYLEYINAIADFADLASASGILTVLRLWNLGHDKGRNLDTLRILHSKFGEEWVMGERGARIRHKLHIEYGERFEWPDTDATDYGERVFCYGLSDHFGILSDGRVIPCCLDREGVMSLGNIFETPLQQILDSERAEKIRQGFRTKHAEEELCRRCGYARRFKL